jgi:hypothetical protein
VKSSAFHNGQIVSMPRVLSGLAWNEHQFACPHMVDIPATAERSEKEAVLRVNAV